MTVEYIEAMKDCCKGQSLAILGGGPSLVQDIKALPQTTQLWGVNQHTAILPLDLIVFIDSKLWPYIKDYHTKFLTRTAECDETNKDIIRVRHNSHTTIQVHWLYLRLIKWALILSMLQEWISTILTQIEHTGGKGHNHPT